MVRVDYENWLVKIRGNLKTWAQLFKAKASLVNDSIKFTSSDMQICRKSIHLRSVNDKVQKE